MVVGNEESQNNSDIEEYPNSEAELLSEVYSEEETELRKICKREFAADEIYEDYDPKDLKYISGHELRSVLEVKRKAEEKEENE